MPGPSGFRFRLFPASCLFLLCPAPLYGLGNALAPLRRKIALLLGNLLGSRCNSLAYLGSASSAEQCACLLQLSYLTIKLSQNF